MEVCKTFYTGANPVRASRESGGIGIHDGLKIRCRIGLRVRVPPFPPEIMNNNFLSNQKVKEIVEEFGSPVFVYDEEYLRLRAKELLEIDMPFGLVIRYAMKANPSAAILRIFNEAGLEIDASSGYEAERAILAGVAPEKIQITSQEYPHNIAELNRKGVKFNATSLNQLERFGKEFSGSDVSVRINPGLGSGGTNRTNTGGPASSFGIWRECVDEAKRTAKSHDLKITGVHTHIGSGSDPDVWQKVSKMSIDMLDEFTEATTLNLGGGYKTGRLAEEPSADMPRIMAGIKEALSAYKDRTGREIKLEIEPGTYLVANAAILIASVQDIADTGEDGYNFLKLDTGMNDILRPSMYGAQHPIFPYYEGNEEKEYVVVGHNCESGDILTTAPGDSEALKPVKLPVPKIGDIVGVGGAGAYCSAMRASGYNSFPDAAEVMISEGKEHLIRKRPSLIDLISLEI